MEKLTIVDAALTYDRNSKMNTYLWITRNVLYITSMDDNLVPPFLMHESGILVNDVTRIHCGEDMSHGSHSIIFQEEDIELLIPLILDGTISYLPTRILKPEDIEKYITLKQYSLPQTQRLGINRTMHMKRNRTTLFITKEI